MTEYTHRYRVTAHTTLESNDLDFVKRERANQQRAFASPQIIPEGRATAVFDEIIDNETGEPVK